jgi:hypothetical protein
MVMLLGSLGCALLLLRAQARGWEWMPVAVVGPTRAVSLLLLAMHLLTDVAGGTLISLTRLAVVSIFGVARAAPKRNVEYSPSDRDIRRLDRIPKCHRYIAAEGSRRRPRGGWT